MDIKKILKSKVAAGLSALVLVSASIFALSSVSDVGCKCVDCQCCAGCSADGSCDCDDCRCCDNCNATSKADVCCPGCTR